ncbi:type III restriction enzyme, res subunit [Shewanella denitrificans OS217]|uniref:Type III restriction enzyme, res subunit n=1 Tax=Shewanella denitrificans (strain OS217 / ATCC BAA-1090 / DSM 15013) TaxID=318161 RepID=Q12SI0_SHEDO|nr:DUF3427 domain-containing protein [Shewanella denitrificans]ABE53596.1 type III restriction enzyme, res subunit [Shewanella denitrificans OS217]
MEQVGIYEKLITQLIDKSINRDVFYLGERPLESAEASVWLSRFLSKIIECAIGAIPSGDNQLTEQIGLANKLVLWLKDHVQDDQLITENLLDSKGRILTALFDKTNPIATDFPAFTKAIYPLTGLSQSELFCGSNAGISLDTELKREIRSADKIYWLVSFIKWAGIRIFKNELEEFTRSGKTLRIITTSYMGATDAKAVEFLASLPNTEVKLSYNTKRERLHAKSYLFLRNTGFHTGYIGSSNLSHSALTSGLEWNLKITTQEIPHIIDKSLNTFESYWQSSEFELFKGDIGSKNKLQEALREAKGGYSDDSAFHFDIKPFAHQREILEQLDVERTVHQRYKNLVVAATGTGKTLISAFDFARFYKQHPEANFLFVAHRQEILKQALSAYRGVLKNNQFGELWVAEHKPNSYRHLFASVQSLNLQLLSLPLTVDFYDYIVIDEVHHIAANSYRGLLAHFSPKILLGLTATPERHDGQNILDDFCGVIAAEIRLPEAINQRYLCPFQYFAIDDDTDLRKIKWHQGRYDIAELSHLYTHNEQRVVRIISSLNDTVTDIHQIKALAFCVSKEHAEYMASKFNLAGISADVLTSDNSHERQQKRQSLISGHVNILCVVDIFNEGVDIPNVDTLLFLRPTESLTIFLQQLGRGLRLTDDKQCCTVLDFVGNSRDEYDFSQKFRALVGKTNQSIKDEITNDFPHLPLGCRIELEEQTQAMILRNISRATMNASRLRQLINNFGHQSTLTLSLVNFLRFNPNVNLEDIYKLKMSWLELVESARKNQINEPNLDASLAKAYYRAINNHLFACSSISYLQFLKQLIIDNFSFDDMDATQCQFALMCHYNFWDKSGAELGFTSIKQSLAALRHAQLQAELLDVISLLIERIHHNELEMLIPAIPSLKVHSRYTREQILAASGASYFGKKSTAREGVLVLKALNVELLFVTLKKSVKQFSPTTMYHDYAINESLFHWQSQNSARPEYGRGLGYIEHEKEGRKLILFVREQATDENGRTMGFVNFGEVIYMAHSGTQPMNITWKLMTPMPDAMWHEAAKLAVG